MFRMLSADTRVRILDLLGRGPRTVSAIARHLKISQPAASQHLSQLRGAGLVTDRRDGQFVVYEVIPEAYARYRLGSNAFGWRGPGPGRAEQMEAYRAFLKAELERVEQQLDLDKKD
jgi:DNA-binding transcriptional ArsR family regulator